MSDMSEIFGQPIRIYTRAQAIEDGVLIDVSEMAREAGIKYPVALTCAAWSRCVEVPEGCEGLQDEQGRLWDVLWMLRCAMNGARGNEILYKLHVVRSLADLKRERPAPLVTLKAVCGPGDNAEPVITIMLPGED